MTTTINKLDADQINNIKNILAENHLSGGKLSLEDLSQKAGVTTSVLSYYKSKWGYSKKHLKRKAKKQLPEGEMSLSQAIAVCKKNGLKVTREKMVIEEL